MPSKVWGVNIGSHKSHPAIPREVLTDVELLCQKCLNSTNRLLIYSLYSEGPVFYYSPPEESRYIFAMTKTEPHIHQ